MDIPCRGQGCTWLAPKGGWHLKNPSTQVTEGAGWRLNAFAKEPRMVEMEIAKGKAQGPASKRLLLGGAVLVLTLVAVAARIR